MQLNIRPLNYEDYDTTLVGWWNDWGWQVAPKRELLPANGIGGVMVYDGDVPVCAAFLYTTNSGIAWIDWIVSSKTYTNKKGRKEALNILVESLTNTAKNLLQKSYKNFKQIDKMLHVLPPFSVNCIFREPY